jgi:ABC-type antimicrobial peptide transport system ATPase subunit
MIDNSILHVKKALDDLDKEMEQIVMNLTLSLQEKDNLMLPLVLEKKVLKQTIEDLEYLKANPPAPNQPCGISKYRND